MVQSSLSPSQPDAAGAGSAPSTAALSATFAGAVAALVGVYWDDAWHTDKGRDAFLSEPHLMLYGGVGLAAVVIVVSLVGQRRRRGSMRAALDEPWLRLGAVGLAFVAISAPIDEAWHVLFGRDAVVWSPPHLLAIAGVIGLVAAILLGTTQLPGRRREVAVVAATAALLAAALVPVMEYESDVPQFASLWYLPVLVAGAMFAFAVAEHLGPRAWTATAAAAVYTGLRVGVFMLFSALDHSTTFIPPILAPALAYDLAARRGWGALGRAAAVAAAAHLAYVPWLNLLLGGVEVSARDVLVSLPLSAAVGALVWAVVQGQSLHRLARRAAPAAVAAAVLLLPVPALAHDPGQGPIVLEAEVVGHSAGERASITVTAAEPCPDFEALQTTARRAGVTLHAPLLRTGDCEFTGAVDLPTRGRWFVYAELLDGDQLIETWVPVVRGQDHVTAVDRALYIPPEASLGTFQVLTGIALAIAQVLFLAAVIRTTRAAARTTRPAAAARWQEPAAC